MFKADKPLPEVLYHAMSQGKATFQQFGALLRRKPTVIADDIPAHYVNLYVHCKTRDTLEPFLEIVTCKQTLLSIPMQTCLSACRSLAGWK